MFAADVSSTSQNSGDKFKHYVESFRISTTTSMTELLHAACEYWGLTGKEKDFDLYTVDETGPHLVEKDQSMKVNKVIEAWLSSAKTFTSKNRIFEDKQGNKLATLFLGNSVGGSSDNPHNRGSKNFANLRFLDKWKESQKQKNQKGDEQDQYQNQEEKSIK